MRRFRRPNRPASPAGTAGVPQPSTSHGNLQAPLAPSSSTPPGPPTRVQQAASNAPGGRHGHVKDDVLDLAVTITGVGKEVANTFSLHGLAPGLAALLEVLKKIQVMAETVKGVDNLKQETDDLMKAAAEFSMRNPGQNIPEVLRGTINELTSTWKKTEESAAKISRRGKMKRFFSSASDARELRNLVGDISSTIRRATLLGGWDIRLAVGKVQDNLDAMTDQQDEKFMPPHAESAAYNANSARPRQSCMEGTREDILEDAWTWVRLRIRGPDLTSNTEGDEGALVSTDEAQGFIHWTCGLAGTGKTTIACSIAKRCQEEGVLGASFFFSRFDSQCDNPRLLFTTISRQLCRVHPAYRAKVIAVMKKDPDITSSVPAVQFEKLILEPLEQLTGPFSRLAIIVDALDECRSDDNTSSIFYILSRFEDRVIRFFLFILASRPEPDIVAHFDQTRSGPLGEVTTRLFLHMVKLEPVLQDIRHFLTRHLKETLDRRVPREWPSDENIAVLSNLSEGLFIFARTAVNLIMDKNSMDPVKTLERVVQRQSRRSQSVSILGELYRQILDEAHPDADEELQVSIRRVVGALVIAVEPLSVATLAGLLELPEGLVWGVLSQIYPVLHIPDNNAKPIHFIHPTFPEFLLQVSPGPLPLLPPRFAIETAKQHRAVFVRSLKTMGRYLRYDIIDLKDPGVFKKEIPDLQARVQEHIPPHLSYACRNWSIHFRRSRKRLGPRVFRTFRWFLRTHLLHWLEALSLLDMLSDAPFFLDVARRACKSLNNLFLRLAPFLFDARRFVLTYMTAINAVPLQVRHSALGLAPSGSVVSQTYLGVQLKQSPAVRRGGLQEWGPGLDSFTGHSRKWINAVTFSSDNTFFVSGGNDGMVKVWQASTRTFVLEIQTSSESILAVAYSPDGLHIAAGGDRGLSIWHAASGAQIRIITDDDITHATYTAEGSRLLSASNEGKVQLWRVSDGECLLSLDGDGRRQAGVSPDGAVIAFTRDASLLLYDVSSGKYEDLELPRPVNGATFSPDGRYIAAATKGAIQIWSHPDKSLVRSINIPTVIDSRLSFSPDGTRICCGREDGLVCVWDVEGDRPARELKGHTNWVRHLAWSPDGSQIISTSYDGTIRLWDVSDHSITRQPHAPSTRPSSGPPRLLVAEYKGVFMYHELSPQPIASLFLPSRDGSTANDAPIFTAHPDHAAAWDHVLSSSSQYLPERDYCWAALTGQTVFPRETMLAISNNGSLLAYATARDICIRSLTTGGLVTTLIPEFESNDISSIVFSPDDSHLASGSWRPAAVAVWDVTAGTCAAYHHYHSGYVVCCVTFSSDGRFVVSGSNDGTARVFDISTKQVTCVLGPHNSGVVQVMRTTDDKLLMSQDGEGALYIWGTQTGSLIASFPSSDGLWITTLHFSPTGLFVSTGDGEHTLELWKAGDRAWPVYYIAKEGWVYAKGPGYTRRLAWLPPEWRHPVCSDGATFCVSETDIHDNITKLVELDMSRLLDHVGIPYVM